MATRGVAPGYEGQYRIACATYKAQQRILYAEFQKRLKDDIEQASLMADVEQILSETS